MNYHMFSVYDEKAKAYLPPFILPEIGMATRTFGDCVNDEGHQFGKHPADYTLFKIADYDDETGVPTPNKSSIGNGVEFINQEIQHLKAVENE
jgi:hypothetical protein